MGLPSTKTKMGFVCEEPKMRTASQLLRSTRASKLTSWMVPSARISFRAMGLPFMTNSTCTGVADARSLDVPIRVLIDGAVADVARFRGACQRRLPVLLSAIGGNIVGIEWDGIEKSRDFHAGADSALLCELYLACLAADFQIIYGKIHQVASAVGDVTSPVVDRLQPAAVTKRTIHFGVDAPLTYACIRDAREIGLPRDSRAESHIQGVIPNVQFPQIRRVHRRNEIDRVGMRDVHDVFIGADSVEAGNLVVGQLARLGLESPAGVSKAGHSALRFGPAQNR